MLLGPTKQSNWIQLSCIDEAGNSAKVATGKLMLKFGWDDGGEAAGKSMVGGWDNVKQQLGGDACREVIRKKETITEKSQEFGNLDVPANQALAKIQDSFLKTQSILTES